MRKSRITFISWLVVFLFVSSPLIGENISFKISYNTASVSKGDLNTWIDSYNARWTDWQSVQGGQLNGQLNPVKYGPKYEVELRIPLFAGFGLNLSGSHFKSMEEGIVNFVYNQQNKAEKDFIRNEISGIPIKIGISYAQALPFSENLLLFAGVGRHITFLKYKFNEEYELRIGDANTYILKQDFSYNSEALGFYATFGAEYNFIKQIAIVFEAEKVWSKADGFMGPYKTDFYDPFSNTHTIHPDPNNPNAPKNASLFFYENRHGWSNKYYSSFEGHTERPTDPEDYPVGIVDIRNIRQGEFDLSTFAFKIGIRFKF
jgi:hypothetical protein